MFTPGLSHHCLSDSYDQGAHLPVVAVPHRLCNSVLPHDHDFEEIALVLAGSAKHVSLAGEQTVGRGDVVVVPTGVWHSYYEWENLELFNCCIRTDFLRQSLKALPHREGANLFLHPGVEHLSGNPQAIVLRPPTRSFTICHQQLDEIRHLTRVHTTLWEYLYPDYKPRHVQETICYDEYSLQMRLIGHLYVFLSELNAGVPPASQKQQRRQIHEAVQTSIALMKQRPAHPWSLEELAGSVHLDRAYLVRLFKKNVGLSPLAFLGRHRAEQAASLLVLSDVSIGDIGLQVGWPDPCYFSERFKSHLGLSPRAYRKRFREAT